jgi:endoglucanase
MDYVGAKGSDFVIGPALDDVSAIVSVIKTLEKLKENPPRGLKVYAVATVQEEIGSRGAHVAGYNLNPTDTINSDTTSAIAPGVDISRVGDVKLGNGPAIAFGPCFSKELCELMEKEAKLNNIPYQRRVVPDRSGNDSWELQVVKGGSICGLLSMPSKYMHSANEVVSLNDVKNVGELFYYTIKSLEKNNIKHTTELFRRT